MFSTLYSCFRYICKPKTTKKEKVIAVKEIRKEVEINAYTPRHRRTIPPIDR